MHIMYIAIFVDAYCAYSAYCNMHTSIVHIVYIHNEKSLILEEEAVPVWRTLESHTRLVLVHGVHRRLQIDWLDH